MIVPRQWLSVLIVASVAAALAVAEDFTIRDNVNLVLLDVSVKNSRGAYVQGLERGNFQVSEDGRRRNITHFANVDVPVTVGLVVDNSGSMRLRRPEVVMAGLAFAKQSNPADQFFVVNFNDRCYFGLPSNLAFTDQLQTLRSALYYGRPMGQTALYDAVAAALRHLQLSDREKRTLIVVSDGGDNASRSSLQDVIALAQASRATIYSVAIIDPLDHELNPRALRKLSTITGGEFLRPQSPEEVLSDLEKISRDIRKRYSIGYVPALAGSKKLVHKVKVTVRDVNGQKLSALTRSSYTTALTEQFDAREQGVHHHAQQQ